MERIKESVEVRILSLIMQVPEVQNILQTYAEAKEFKNPKVKLQIFMGDEEKELVLTNEE